MIAKRINYKGGGGYQGGPTGPVERSGVGGISAPAGGASAGGNYGGNRNTEQTYGGNRTITPSGNVFASDDPRIAEQTDYVGETIFGPTQKYTGASSFFGGANKYGYQDQYVDPSKANFGQVKPGYGGRLFGGLMSLLTGIPFIGGALGTAYDYGTDIFRNKFYDDMSQYNQLGLGGQMPEDTFGQSDQIISETSPQQVSFDPSNFNKTASGIDTLGVDPIKNIMQVAELTKAQQKALNKQKMGLDTGLFTIEDIQKNIEPLNNPNSPATIDEIKAYYGIA